MLNPEQLDLQSQKLLDIFIDLDLSNKNKVIGFAENLKKDKVSNASDKLNLSWAGGLSEYKNQTNSKSLQKQALEMFDKQIDE